MRSPGYAKLVNWISEIWESIDSNLIAKSFDVCGITSNGDSLSTILKTILSSNVVIVVDECESDELEVNENDLFDVEIFSEAAPINTNQTPAQIQGSDSATRTVVVLGSHVVRAIDHFAPFLNRNHIVSIRNLSLNRIEMCLS
jgi:hypothetical protein